MRINLISISQALLLVLYASGRERIWCWTWDSEMYS